MTETNQNFRTPFAIAASILDDAAEEYRDGKLSSIEAVQQYAAGAHDTTISDKCAQLVLDACLAFLSDDDTGFDRWYRIVEFPLSDIPADLY